MATPMQGIGVLACLTSLTHDKPFTCHTLALNECIASKMCVCVYKGPNGSYLLVASSI